MIATKEEIDGVLNELKKAIKNKELIIDKRKPKNRNFITYYNLPNNKIYNMLNELECENFSKKDIDKDNKNEYVYIFGRKYIMNYYGIEEEKSVYIKITKRNRYLVMSFHEAEHEMVYPFK